MSALNEIFASFTTVFNAEPLKKGEAATDKLVDKLKELAVVVSAGALVTGINNMVQGMATMATQLQRTATQFGLSTQALQEWQIAAGQSGIQADQFADGLKTLQERLGEAMQDEDAAKRFAQWGIDIRDANNELLPTERILENISAAMRTTTDDATASQRAIQLFGDSGARLGTAMRNGRFDLEAARREMEELGGITEETIEVSEELTNANRRQEQAWVGLSSAMTLAFGPAITQITEGITSAIAWLSNLETETGAVSTTLMLVLGALALKATVSFATMSASLAAMAGRAIVWYGAMAISAVSSWAATAAAALAGWAAVLGPVAAVIAAIAAVIFVVQDLYSWFQGGESVIGDLANSFGTFMDELYSGTGLLARWGQAILLPFRALQYAFKTLLFLHGKVMNAMGVAGYENMADMSFEDAMAMDADTILMDDEQLAAREARDSQETNARNESIAEDNAAMRTTRASSSEEPYVAPSVTAGIASGRTQVIAAPVATTASARRSSGNTVNTNNQFTVNVSSQGLDEQQVARLVVREAERMADQANRDALEDQEALG